MNVGRNEPCPCGSGEKYKRCCEGKATQSQKLWRGLAVLIALIVILVTVGIIRGGVPGRGCAARTRLVAGARSLA